MPFLYLILDVNIDPNKSRGGTRDRVGEREHVDSESARRF